MFPEMSGTKRRRCNALWDVPEEVLEAHQAPTEAAVTAAGCKREVSLSATPTRCIVYVLCARVARAQDGLFKTGDQLFMSWTPPDIEPWLQALRGLEKRAEERRMRLLDLVAVVRSLPGPFQAAYGLRGVDQLESMPEGLELRRIMSGLRAAGNAAAEFWRARS
jgi:hypothetical protein